ncbi:biotin--[acetyl-CoA-carboxylase] ligase [Paenibacillaceae bacterium WGS1546]|uniref:biotin--[acetyl-CoA-carboxylase] ligase n=1 Tax=Cohnella sp. WGS1546 TaxID=3366810 RepID=UPI00372D4E7C
MTTSKLLALLEESGEDYLSGEEISRQLNVSRTAVWKQVRKLEAEGYTVEAVPRLGYRLRGKPSRLSSSELLAKLRTERFGRRLHLLDVATSTQDELKKLAEEGAEEGTLVIAESQTNGRGRMGRSWVSPGGKGVWMSLLLRPPIPLQLTPQLTLLAAVALSRAIARQMPELQIGIKWPNDLLVEGKKISGILLESAAEDERLKYVIAGLAISANLDPDDFPPEVREKAVSLKTASGRPVDRAELVVAALAEFERLYELYLEQGFAPIRSLWEARSVTLGVRTELRTPQETIVGVPRSLDETGGLRVELSDGSVRTIYSGEVADRRDSK